MRGLFNRKEAATSTPPQAKQATKQAQTFSQINYKRNNATVKSQFGKQFGIKTHYGKVAKTKAGTIKVQSPHYVPIGSGLASAHIARRKGSYFGEGIF